MKPSEFLAEGAGPASYWHLHFTACMFQRYHKIMANWHHWADRGIRIVLGAVAVFAVVFGLSTHEHLAVAFDILTLLVAVAVNVVPFSDREVLYNELSRRWTDLRQDLDMLEQDVRKLNDSTELPDGIHERFKELWAKKNLIDVDEPALFESLRKRCYEDENARLHGHDVRTHAQLVEHRKAKAASNATPAPIG